MEWILFIFLLALLPALLSLILIRRAKQRFHTRIRRIRQRYQDQQSLNSALPSDTSHRYQEFIGDINCRHNAHSPYLRCAINPYGPCEGCSSYEARYTRYKR